MSIWIDKDGRRHVGVMVAGRRVHRILPASASSSDAKRVEAEIRSSLGRREVVIPGDPPLSKVMALYLKHADTLRSPETAKNHAVRCGPWTEGKKASDARQVAAAIVQDMRGQYADGTINRTLGALSKALHLAWERGQTTEDYSSRVKRLPERNMRDVVLTLAQVKKIAENASESVRAAIWIALYTGCRRGEICSIRKEDIGDASITLRAGNTKSLRTRMIPITTPLRPWLKHLPLSISVEGLKTGFRRAREAAGLPHANFHDLRRSCATMMIEAGVDLFVVSKLLGHSSVQVTQSRYALLQTKAIAAGLEQTFTPKITQAKKKGRPRKSGIGRKSKA